MDASSTLAEFEKIIGVTFTDKTLLKQLLTHRSYLNEATAAGLEHNERLEFLGDAVLEMVVTEHLYRNFTNPEGELTNWRSAIVRGEILAQVAAKIDLGKYLFLSRGEEKSGGRNRNLLLANAFEALIGAIYLDQGYKAAADFIHHHLVSLLPEIIEKKLYVDPKSRLQELSQEAVSQTPEYRVLSEEGPDHTKIFTVGAYVGKKLVAEGKGSSKQKAETAAAVLALEKWDSFISEA